MSTINDYGKARQIPLSAGHSSGARGLGARTAASSLESWSYAINVIAWCIGAIGLAGSGYLLILAMTHDSVLYAAVAVLGFACTTVVVITLHWYGYLGRTIAECASRQRRD